MKKFRCIFCKNKKINYLKHKDIDIVKFCKNCNVKFFINKNIKNNVFISEINYFIEINNIKYLISLTFSKLFGSSNYLYVHEENDFESYYEKGYVINEYPFSIHNATTNINIFENKKYHPKDVKESLIKYFKLRNLL